MRSYRQRRSKKETETQLPPLPEEIIEDILKRLPVESLVRFSCTCKRWYSLIFSDSKFNKAHIDHAKRPSWKFLEIRDSRKLLRRTIDCDCNVTTISRRNPKRYLRYDPIRLLGSCNGLLFFEGYAMADKSKSQGNSISHSRPKDYVLWNPYTNSIKRIDELVGGTIHNSISGLSYDRTSDDYKTIVVLYNPSTKPSPHVFSLRRNSWKKLTDDLIFRTSLILNDSCGITLDNGNICYWELDISYWELDLGHSEIAGYPLKSVICFDPVMEKFKYVPLPDNLLTSERNLNSRIGALDGCLSLIHINSIWVMKEFGCWTKLYDLQCDLSFTYQPIGYNSSKDQVLLKLGPSLWIADLKEGIVKLSYNNLVTSIYSKYFVPYTESLLCPWLGL